MCKKGLLSSSARRRNWRQANTTVIGSSQNRSGDDGSFDSRSATGAPNSAGTGAPENGHAALKSPRLSSPGGPVVAGGPPNMGGRVGTSNFTTSLSIHDEDTSPVGLLNLKILAHRHLLVLDSSCTLYWILAHMVHFESGFWWSGKASLRNFRDTNMYRWFIFVC